MGSTRTARAPARGACRRRSRARGRSSTASSSCGRNSCSGGSRSRIVTGLSPHFRKMPTKSSAASGGASRARLRRSFSFSATIICRTAPIRFSPKNMCSVRQRPIPSAPKRRATRASVGVSAFARMPRRRSRSAQPRRLVKARKSADFSGASERSISTRRISEGSVVAAPDQVARRPVEREEVPLLAAVARGSSPFLVHGEVAPPGDATSCHTAGTTAACEVAPASRQIPAARSCRRCPRERLHRTASGRPCTPSRPRVRRERDATAAERPGRQPSEQPPAFYGGLLP